MVGCTNDACTALTACAAFLYGAPRGKLCTVAQRRRQVNALQSDDENTASSPAAPSGPPPGSGKGAKPNAEAAVKSVPLEDPTRTKRKANRIRRAEEAQQVGRTCSVQIVKRVIPSTPV
jgi:hypothetical protein